MSLSRRSLLATIAQLAIFPPRILHAAQQQILPLLPLTPDDVTVPEGWRWQRIVGMGDIINPAGDIFGADADFLAVFPLDHQRLLLWVNHEFPPSDFAADGRFARILGRTPTPQDMLACMGASVIVLVPDGQGGYKLDPTAPEAWRISGLGPDTIVTGPAKKLLGKTVQGTISNCGGGLTPWGTLFTCEENHRYHIHEGLGSKNGLPGAVPSRVANGGFNIPGLRAEHYGWVVEANPKDPNWLPRRHTALGRMRHESAVVQAIAGEPLRIYMAEDRNIGGIWRYTSRHKWHPSMSADAASKLLEKGKLEQANIQTKQWLPLELTTPLHPEAVKLTQEQGESWGVDPDFLKALGQAQTLGDLYDHEAALLVDASLAGLLIGGSPLGRPEGCIWLEGQLYVALTTATGLPEGHPLRPPMDQLRGNILSLSDHGDSFEWQVHSLQGEGFGQPDNLGVDPQGLLLVATDSDDVQSWGNNMIARFREGAWERILVAPPEAEVCSPCFAPDGTLFCTIQHPIESWGESTLIAVNYIS